MCTSDSCVLIYIGFCFFYLFCHSEPTATVKRGLLNCSASCGEEASFTVELSAVCSGLWTLNGQILRSGADYLITRTKTVHTLLIREVTTAMNGALIKFVGGGSDSVCTLSVKCKLVKPHFLHLKIAKLYSLKIVSNTPKSMQLS